MLTTAICWKESIFTGLIAECFRITKVLQGLSEKKAELEKKKKKKKRQQKKDSSTSGLARSQPTAYWRELKEII